MMRDEFLDPLIDSRKLTATEVAVGWGKLCSVAE